MHRYSRLAGITLLFALSPMAAHAAPVFYDVDFNDVTVPDDPGYVVVPTESPQAGETSTLPSNYSHSPANGTSVRVYEQFVDSQTANTLGGNGDNVLIIEDTDTSRVAYADFALAESEQATSGNIVISLDFIADSTGDDEGQPSNNEFFLNILGTDGSAAVTYKFRQEQGRIVVSGVDTGTLAGNNAFSLGEVTSVRIELDLDENKSYLYLNDELQTNPGLGSTNGEYSAGLADGAGFGTLRILSPTNFTTRLGVDNVHIAVPEPGTIGLGAMGGIMLLARRHR